MNLLNLRRAAFRTIAMLGLGLALLAPHFAHASSTIRTFAVRKTITQRGDVLLVGNTLLTCPTAASGCTTAQNGTGNNNDFAMTWVDIDGDASTFNSSRATLTLPVGATVSYAALYWGGDSAGAPTPASRNVVRFATPVAGYANVTSSNLDVSGTRYAAFADVTTQVQAGGVRKPDTGVVTKLGVVVLISR